MRRPVSVKYVFSFFLSTPIVSFCSLKISLPNTCTVLIFFIAGLLLCLEHVFHWERIASRWRPAFSSHLVSRLTGNLAGTNFSGNFVALFFVSSPRRKFVSDFGRRALASLQAR